MLLHQGIGLQHFNELSHSRAMHALFECCSSVTWADKITDARPYETYAQLYRRADSELGELSESDIDTALVCHPPIGRRPRSARSYLEQSGMAMTDDELDVLIDLCAQYHDRFGFRFLCAPAGRNADELVRDLSDRMHNDDETERKVMRNELAKINHLRLERMLGPEEGYPLY